jgi:hypothetical protein
LERRPVLADDTFEWGEAVVAPTWPEGVPLSNLLAGFVGMLDGQRTLGEALEQVQARLGPGGPATAPVLLAGLRLLFIDGLMVGIPAGEGAATS